MLFVLSWTLNVAWPHHCEKTEVKNWTHVSFSCRIHGSVDCLSELSSSRLTHSFSGEASALDSVLFRLCAHIHYVSFPRRYDPSQLQHVVDAGLSEADQQKPSGGKVGPVCPNRWVNITVGLIFSARSFFTCHISHKRSRSNPQSQRRSAVSASYPGNAGSPVPASDGQVRLHVGMQVLLSSANEMASIRYLGAADFAPGLWLGLELRSPKGKNDGSVGGRRYFSCRPGHGVLVRPSRVTYRGINGSRLLSDSQWRPEEPEQGWLPVLNCTSKHCLLFGFIVFFHPSGVVSALPQGGVTCKKPTPL